MAANSRKSREGFTARELFRRGIGITYADFSIMNLAYSDILREEISLQTDLGKGVVLQTPIIASPMDTVTNAEVAIAIARHGGCAVIHYNHKTSSGNFDIDAQLAEIEKVKRSQSGFIEEPLTASPTMTISEILSKAERYRIGKSVPDAFPVTADGTSDGVLIGFLRKQDYSKTRNLDALVQNRMLARQKVVTATWPLTLTDANDILWERRILWLPIVDGSDRLKYLVTRTDVDKNAEFPLAAKDEKGRLRVLFAVETRMERAGDRLEGGFALGADGAVIDTSQGFTKYEKDMLLHIAKTYPDRLLMGGNVSTVAAAMWLANLNADTYRNGQGPGSICTTAGTIGISRAAAAGVYHAASALRGTRLTTVADGGIREVGDITKTITIGAHAVMLGRMLAGTAEGPGEVTMDAKGQLVKVYRGMGSKEANIGGIRGYTKLPQGITGKVEYKGSLYEWIPLVRDGLITAFQALNCPSIAELHRRMYRGQIRFEQRTLGSMREAGVHDVITD